MTNRTEQTAVRGVYINLASATARRAQCESFLAQAGVEEFYSRFEAVAGKDHLDQYAESGLSAGKIGCWLSHLNVLRDNIEGDYHLHVLEDDFELTSAFPHLIQDLDQRTRNIPDWDILFTDFSLAITKDVFAMRDLIHRVDQLYQNNQYTVEDATNLFAAGNSSYIVNRKSKRKVAELLEQGLGSRLPQDLYMRELARQGKLKIVVTLPYLTTLSDAFMESDILGRIEETNPSIIFNVLFRRALAWGADTGAILEQIRKRLSAQPPIPDRAMIYTHLVAHFVSDEYKRY